MEIEEWSMGREGMKILLIDPQSTYKAPNLGLLYICSSLANSRHEPFLLDLNNYPVDNPVKRVTDLINNLSIPVIGLSITDVSCKWSMEFIDKVKAKRKDITIITGGPQVNIIGREIFEETHNIDYALKGESEGSILEFLDFLEGNLDKEDVPGLLYKSNMTVEENTKGNIIDLDRLLFPDYSFLGIEEISGYMLLTSRGCPYRCIFCARNTGTKWRTRLIDNVIDELINAKDSLNIKSFRIVDASFNLNEARVIEFCDKLTDNNIDIPWMVSGIRADRISDKSVEAMKNAGCEMLAMGIETIDPEVFENIKKGEELEDIINAIEICKNHKLEVGYYMILGLPGDNYERSIKYARKLQAMKPDYVMYNQAVPFRGTDLYDWAQRNAHLNPDFTWQQTRDYDNTAYWTDDFSVQERLESFKIIQTIVKVINFTSDKPDDHEILIKEIKENDPDYLDYHLDYIDNTIRHSINKKYTIKQIHKETDFKSLEDYAGCFDIKNRRMV